MTLPIQRVPNALGQLLSTFGGQTPRELEDSVQGVLDLLQFYGLTQLQNQQVVDAAMAEGATTLTLTVPGNQHWVLFAAHMNVAKTATMTALSLAVQFGPPNQLNLLAAEEFTAFGATVTGGARCGGHTPYPRLLLPGWQIRGNLDILGTDATASAVLAAQVGVLG